MVVLGVLLLAAAAVLAVAVITSNTGTVAMDLWGLTVSSASLGAVFAAGMITTAVGLLGLVLVFGGVRRGHRRRRDRRALLRDQRRLAGELDAAAPHVGTPGGVDRPTGDVPAPPDRVPETGRISAGSPSGRPRARHRRQADTESTGSGSPT